MVLWCFLRLFRPFLTLSLSYPSSNFCSPFPALLWRPGRPSKAPGGTSCPLCGGGDVCREGERCWVAKLFCSSEPAGSELQEAVGKSTFEHVFSNLEPATAYSIHLWAYSAEGASQDSASIHASTMGSSE